MPDDYYSSNEFKQNLHLYEQGGTGRASLDPEALTDIADHYRSEGHMDKALGAAEYALSLYPGATAPLIFKARARLADNDTDGATRYLDQIEDKLDLDYLYMRAEVMIVQCRYDEADQYLESQLQVIDEDDYPDYVLDVAGIFGDYDLPELAEKWLSLSDEKDLDDYRELKGRILLSRGETADAKQIFESLVEKDPFSTTYWNLLANTQYLLKEYEESMTSSEYAIAIDPRNEEALLNKANVLSLRGNHEEALPLYTRFAEISKNTEASEMYLGITLVNLDRAGEAIPHFERALAASGPESPYNADIYNELVIALLRVGDHARALRYVEEAEQSGSNVTEMKVLHGHLLLVEGKPKEAQRYFSEAYFDSGISSNIVLRIANSLYDCGYTDLAYNLLLTLLDGDDESADGYSHLAACAYALGKRDEFLQYLRTAVERNPIEARVILGEMFPPAMEPDEYYEYAKKQLI